MHGTTGAALPATAALTSLGYSGEHFDAKAQQQYLRARWYNPANGRFNRLDPFAGNMQDPQSLHKYAYVHGDPVNSIDPTGMFSLGGMISSTIGFARIAINFPGIRVGVAVGSMLAIAQGASDIRNYMLKQFAGIDHGGYDSTTALTNLRNDIIAKWDGAAGAAGMTTNQKQQLIDEIWQIPLGLTRWDIDEMLNEKKSLWTQGLDQLGIATNNDTLTFRGNVYPVADVNYVLWGLINGLAYRDNLGPTIGSTSKAATVSTVVAYRVAVLGGGWVIKDLVDDIKAWSFPERYDTTYGRAAFAAFGWEWATNPNAPEPFEVRLPNAKPNFRPWTNGLFWSAGKDPRTVFSGRSN